MAAYRLLVLVLSLAACSGEHEKASPIPGIKERIPPAESSDTPITVQAKLIPDDLDVAWRWKIELAIRNTTSDTLVHETTSCGWDKPLILDAHNLSIDYEWKRCFRNAQQTILLAPGEVETRSVTILAMGNSAPASFRIGLNMREDDWSSKRTDMKNKWSSVIWSNTLEIPQDK
jgi:hypothetical protein